MTNTRKVIPCGKLFSQGRGYFLLHPEPVVKDSWQGDNCYRFVVVPDNKISEDVEPAIYPSSRHIVTNAFVIDYMNGMPEITILMQESVEEVINQWSFEDLVPELWKI